MPNWNLINQSRLRKGPFGTGNEDGFNGAFMFKWVGEPKEIFCIASDGMGWKHVSVSFWETNTSTPSWEVMCFIKDIFWDEHDAVIQIHPSKSDYINIHGGCLHLFQCIDGREQPLPPSIMVGPKGLSNK
jgi:hypothetical protein